MQSGEIDIGGHKGIAITDHRERKRDTLLIWQKKLCSTGLGELTRAGQVIGMDVRVKDTCDLPALGLCQVEVHLRVQRGINHDGLLAFANEIGEASFSGAPHLDDTGTTLLHRYLSDIPGQTPRLHATGKAPVSLALPVAQRRSGWFRLLHTPSQQERCQTV